MGFSIVGGLDYATEWSGGNVINLGGLPGYTKSQARGINNAGQVVGLSYVGARVYATEWSGGTVVNLTSGSAWARRAVDEGVTSCPRAGCGRSAPPGLPGSTDSEAFSINEHGQAVGYSQVATPLRPAGLTPRHGR